MRKNALRPVRRIGLLVAMTLLSMSCTLPSRQQEEPGQLRHADRSPLSRKLTQVDFGGKASYAACMEPACPAVTRKTLAVTMPAAIPATPQAIDTFAADHPTLRLATTLQTPPARHRVFVRFTSGSANLSPSEKSRLDRAMAEAPETGEVAITGYTDNTGSLRANRRLAQARAQTVHDHLRTRLPANQTTLALVSQAACCFLAANDTPQGRKQNRRVEVVVRPQRQAPP
ncbi:OmpA family protein [Noviherbaspirillum sedimenti]|uniref:OmpA family protein n=1 Tax=Noviherbaspirillum sedimenti TaxID=2320865 RepID=A0A3A3G265_9BURK|nr:OmpA family protein [Noviherbaspirillum sedimenti]RJG00572.1 OmpA family protein [Noviherbaspirillum sedimenti]